MILKSIHIKNFGKLKDKEIELQPGLNLIYGPNESGKTTLQHFIKGVFFDFLKPYVKRRTFTGEMEAFEPWQGHVYSGYIHINHNGQELRISRDFGKKQNRLSLIDLNTGEDMTENCYYDTARKVRMPLKYLCQLDEHQYRNLLNVSAYDKEMDQTFTSALRDSYHQMKKGHIQVGNSATVLEEVQKRQKALGSEKRKASPIGQVYQQLQQIHMSIHQVETQKEKLQELDEQLATLRGQYQHTLQLIETEKSSSRQLQLDHMESKRHQQDALEKDLQELRHKKLHYSKYQSVDAQLVEEAYALYTKKEEITKDLKKLKAGQKKLLLIPVGTLVLSISIGIGLWDWIIPLGILAFGGLATLFTVGKKNKALKKLSQQLKQIKQLEQQRPFKVTCYEDYIQAKTGHENYQRLVVEEEEKRQFLGMLATDKEVATREGAYVDESLANRQHELMERISRLEERKKFLMENNEDIMALKAEKDSVLKHKEELELELKALKQVEEALLDITSKEDRDFKDIVQYQLSEKVAKLTNNKYKKLMITQDFEVRVFDEEQDTIVSVNQLSLGSQDLIYLALRLVLIEETRVDGPLILDDTFVQLDDERLSNMLMAINDISKERQVLLFSCQKREQRLLNVQDITFNKINLRENKA